MNYEAGPAPPFLCAGRRARLHGDDATGPTAVQLAGRTVIEGLQAALPPLREARADLHRHERRLKASPPDAPGGWTEVATVDPSLPAATMEWEREGGETLVTLAFRLPDARRVRALGRVLRIVHPDGDALVEIEAESVDWRVATRPSPTDGDGAPAVWLRAASHGRIALRVLSATHPEALRSVRDRLDRFAPAETRWRGDLADLGERGLRMPEGPTPLASTLRWARGRLRFADVADPVAAAPLGEWFVHLAYGASAAGEDEAARRFLEAAGQGARPGPVDPLQLGALLEALGVYGAWTGDLRWMGDRVAALGPAIETGAEGRGGAALARGLEAVARAWEPRCGAQVANALRARARRALGGETAGSAQTPPSSASTTARSLPVVGAPPGPSRDELAAPPPTGALDAAEPDALGPRIRASPNATDPGRLPELLSMYAEQRGVLAYSPGSDPSRGAAVDAGAALRQILGGWLGARPDAGYGRLELRPRLDRYSPPSSLMGLRIGDVRIDLTLAWQADRGIRITMRPVAGRVPAQIVLAPVVPFGVVGSVTLDGAAVDVPRTAVEGGTRVELQFPLDADRVLEIGSGT